MLTLIWDKLRHLGQKFQWIKYLKIARQAGLDAHIPRFGKPHTLAFAGFVNNLTSWRLMFTHTLKLNVLSIVRLYYG